MTSPLASMQAEEIEVLRSQIEHAETTSNNWLQLDYKDKLFTALFAAVLFFVSVTVWTSIWAFGIGTLLYALLTVRLLKGRVYAVVLQSRVTLLRKLLGGRRWLAEKPVANKWWKRPWYALVWAFIRREPIKLTVTKLGEVALIYNARQKTDSFIVEVDGSHFSAESLIAKHDFIEELARIAREVTFSQRDFTVSAAHGIMRRPINRYKIVAQWHEDYDPDMLALIGAELEGEDAFAEVYGQLSQTYSNEELAVLLESGRNLLEQLELSDGHDCQVRRYMTWTIQRSGLFRGALKGGSLADDEVNRLPVASLARSVLNGLHSAGAINPRILGLRETREFVHDALHVASSNEYHKWVHGHPVEATETSDETYERLAVFHKGTPEELEAKVIESSSPHWPRHAIYERKEHAEIDGTFTTTIALTRSRKFTLPDFWRQFDQHITNRQDPANQTRVWYSRVAIGSTANSGAQVWRLNVLIPLFGEITKHISSDVIQVREQGEQLRERQTAAYHSGYTTNFTHLLVVSGRNQRECEDNVRIVRQVADELELSPRIVTGGCRQLDGALCALGIPQL